MSKNSINNVLDNLVDNVTSSVIDKTINYLTPPVNVSKLFKSIHGTTVNNPFKSTENRQDINDLAEKIMENFDERYLRDYQLSNGQLKRMLIPKFNRMYPFVNIMKRICSIYNQIQIIHITDYKTKDFMMVKKMSDGTLSVTYRLRFPDPLDRNELITVSVWDHATRDFYSVDTFDPVTKRKMNFTNMIQPAKSAYNPEQRPWFNIAVDEYHTAIQEDREQDVSWTSAYLFYSDQTPGITGSIALQNNDEIEYILCLDIGIVEISTQYLSKLKIGENGKAFILNEHGEILAYPPEKEKKTAYSNQNVTNELLMMITQIPIYEEEDGVQKVIRYDYKLTKMENCKDSLIQTAYRTGSLETFKREDGGTVRLELDRPLKHKFKFNNENYMGIFRPFPVDSKWNWIVGFVIPENDFMHYAKKNTYFIVTISLITLVMALVLALFISYIISTNLKRLVSETDKVRMFDLDNPRMVKSVLREIDQMGDAFHKMVKGLRSFGKYVPRDVVRYLVQSGDEAELGGEKKLLTVFFSDIENFTSISENYTPDKLVTDLSQYLDEMSEIITRNQGTIDKYIGDAIMAIWNAPRDCEDHAYLACETALLCTKRLKELRSSQYWADNDMPHFNARIGINTGMLVVGNMGSKNRLNYTVIGDAVNLASRVEGINKYYNTHIICTESTYELVKDRIETRKLDIVSIRGKSKPVAIYEILAHKDELSEQVQQFIRYYHDGFNYYLDMDFEKALDFFHKASALNEKDIACIKLIDRCEQYKLNPPGPDWDRSCL